MPGYKRSSQEGHGNIALIRRPAENVRLGGESRAIFDETIGLNGVLVLRAAIAVHGEQHDFLIAHDGRGAAQIKEKRVSGGRDGIKPDVIRGYAKVFDCAQKADAGMIVRRLEGDALFLREGSGRKQGQIIQ